MPFTESMLRRLPMVLVGHGSTHCEQSVIPLS